MQVYFRPKKAVEMRKGFFLVEMIVVIAVIFVVSLPLARLTTITLRDIPKSYRMIESNSSVLNALKQIQKDVNMAKGFPKSFESYTTDDQNLLIELDDSTICYQLKDEKIIKLILANTKTADDEEIASWLVPYAKIVWQVLRQENKGYAVEVKTYLEHKSGKNVAKKMANSHLYFRGAYQEAVK